MRTLVGVVCVLVLLACAGPALARGVGAERSAYGRFEFAEGADGRCRISFRNASGKLAELFTVDGCVGGLPGVNVVGAIETVGALAFPALARDGQEFHVFGIASARGGNAVATSDYWLVIVRREDTWATRAPFATATLRAARMAGDSPVMLQLEDPATTTAAGTRYLATFGSISQVVLPMLPSTVVFRGTRVFVGELQGGFHATNFRPSIKVGADVVIIDQDGPCPLQRAAERGGQVRLTGDVTKWSDGRQTVTCVAIQRL